MTTTRNFLHRYLIIGGTVLLLQACGPHYVAVAPTAPVIIRPNPPYANSVWIDGGWRYRGGRHNYTTGYWGRPRHGRTYYSGQWQQNPRGYYWNNGRWR